VGGNGTSTNGAGIPILVVDDNEVNAKLLGTTLTLEGHQVQVARDAEETMAVLAGFEPRLIFMDIQLPGIDGLELTRRLKADPHWSSVPVIAVTAYAREEDRERSLQAGCDGYLAKPIDTRALAGVVDGCVGGNCDGGCGA